MLKNAIWCRCKKRVTQRTYFRYKIISWEK
nr:MAG TPA: hypothetical protein [Caudoviricetes sp.]